MRGVAMCTGTSAFILVGIGIPSASLQSLWLLELHMEKVPKYDTLNGKKGADKGNPPPCTAHDTGTDCRKQESHGIGT